MTTADKKEIMILTASLNFIAKEFDKSTKHMSIEEIKTNDSFIVERKVLRLISQLSSRVRANTQEIQADLEDAIAETNKQVFKDKAGYIDSVIGLSVLFRYKTDFKNKKYGKGFNLSELNSIYHALETTNKTLQEDFSNSHDVADVLYSIIVGEQKDIKKSIIKDLAQKRKKQILEFKGKACLTK